MKLKIDRKHVIVLLIMAAVLSIALYFYFSPADLEPGAEGTTEYKEMEKAIIDYNDAFVTYSDSYSALAKFSNSIYDDRMLNSDEIEEYISLLEPFIDACDDVKRESFDVKEVVEKHNVFFQNASQTVHDFDVKEDAMENDMNNMVMTTNALKGNIKDETSEYFKTLTDLNLKLIEIRDR